MSNYLSPEEHDKRIKLYIQGMKDSEIAIILGMSQQGICKWRRRCGLGLYKPEKVKKKPVRPRQNPAPFYTPSKDAHIYMAMLRERFLDPVI